jgi:rubrerythrin
MTEIQAFVESAVDLERSAGLRYEELADAITGLEAAEVVSFLREQAVICRQHMQQANSWQHFRNGWDGTDQTDSPYWPPVDNVAPIAAFRPNHDALPLWAADGFLPIGDAMAIALEVEESARVFCARVAESTTDPDVRRLAVELAKEEAAHVDRVKAAMDR